MPTLRENDAYIKGEDIQDISYLPNTANVSAGQPINPPPTISKNAGEFLICEFIPDH